MPGDLIRILSDIHYGERSSRVRSLRQLLPLFDGATSLVLNGDTLDTRAGPYPELNAQTLGEVKAFFSALRAPVTFLTGNHDPDMSDRHFADLGGGRVFVTHGDIVFATIVPWGRDAPTIHTRMRAALAGLPDWEDLQLEERLRVLRQVSASIPQRHQAERHPLKYTLRLAMDTVWPPARIVRIMRCWSEAPRRAAALLQKHRPHARFALIGHTHRPDIWRSPSGATIVNTGAFCWPSGSFIVDISPSRLSVRRVAARRGEFHPGEKVAEFALDT